MRKVPISISYPCLQELAKKAEACEASPAPELAALRSEPRHDFSGFPFSACTLGVWFPGALKGAAGEGQRVQRRPGHWQPAAFA